MNFLNFLTIILMSSSSVSLSLLVDSLPFVSRLIFKANPLAFLSFCSSSAILDMFISYSLNFPKSSALVIWDRFLDSLFFIRLAAIFSLSDFRILTFTSSSSNFLPRPFRLLTMWVNLF
ncbi:hypothetical protein Fmac_005880 [Flemingia macrophylla]|uniref:NADH dehydrogenase subunit 5 n=1 Tax=Flemingia macrophylla TaxID=520843 RepID=A0ABD1N918_9FABA